MKQAYGHISKIGAALLCLSLAVWSVTPAFSHAPAVFETLQDHLDMVEDHGHSHGLEEDLYWAMHGHSHDVADHDHAQAFLAGGPAATPEFQGYEAWQMRVSTHGPNRQFRIDRPPRV